VARDHGGDHGLDLRLVGDVQAVRIAASELARDRARRRLVEIARGDVGTGLGQRLRGRAADAAAGARDQRDAALQAQQSEIVGHCLPSAQRVARPTMPASATAANASPPPRGAETRWAASSNPLPLIRSSCISICCAR